MMYVLLGCLALLIITVGIQLFTSKYEAWTNAAITFFGAGTLLVTLLVLFSRSVKNVEFLHPLAFILLLFPIAVFWAYTAGRRFFARTVSFPLVHLHLEQDSLRVLCTRWTAPILYTLALLLMTLALARPVRVDRTVLPPTQGIDIMLVMDVSASMQKDDFYPSRFVAAQHTALRFIEKRLNDRIGVVAFAKSALLQAPLTLDHEALSEYVSSLYLGMVNPNFTAIGDGLAVGANHLKDSKAKSKIIILLTDGDSNAGAIEPLVAAQAAATYGIRVYTIGTASAPGQNPYASTEDEINEGLLLEIANRTGGKFYRAKNETELANIYDTINTLEKTEFTAGTHIHRADAYQPLLLLALCLLLLGLVVEKLIFIKVP